MNMIMKILKKSFIALLIASLLIITYSHFAVSDEPQPVLIKREASVDFYRNPDGTVKAIYYPTIVNYRMDNGTYSPINLSLQRTNRQGYDWQLESGINHKAFFRNNTNTAEAVRFEKDGYFFSYDVSGGQLIWHEQVGFPARTDTLGGGVPSNSQNTMISQINDIANYSGAFSNTDLFYVVKKNMLKEEFVLKSLPSIKPYLYLEYTGNIKFNASLSICANDRCYIPSGSQDNFETSGSIEFKDINNITRFYITSPVIRDSSGKNTTGIYKVLGSNAQMNFWLRINRTFLENATFPIYIDPTIQYNFSVAQGVSMFAKECESGTDQPPPDDGAIPTGCTGISDITTDNAIDKSDDSKIETTSQVDSDHIFVLAIANLSNFVSTPSQVTLINWTWEGCIDTAGNTAYAYLWNASSSSWFTVGSKSGALFCPDTINYYNISSHASDFINSSLFTHFIMHFDASTTGGSDVMMKTDWIKLEVTYASYPIIYPVSDFSKSEDTGNITFDFTANESDAVDTGASLNWTVTSNDTNKILIDSYDIINDKFNLSLVGNATGFVNISLALNNSVGLYNYSSFIVNILPINDPPSKPVSFAPSNATTTSDTTPTFSWLNSTDIDTIRINYTLEIYNHTALEIANLTQNITQITETASPTAYTITTPLITGSYYWRVLAWDGLNISSYSELRTLSIDANFPSISNEQIVPPTSQIQNFTSIRLNATISDTDLDEVWLESDYVTPNTFVNYTTQITNISTNYTYWIYALNITNHKTIKWRYYANDSSNNLAVGNLQQFSIINMPPNGTFSSPENDTTFTINAIELVVNTSDVENDTVKVLFYGDTTDEPTTLINSSALETAGNSIEFNWTGRTNNVRYYWRFKTQDNQGDNSGYSDTRTFISNPSSPIIIQTGLGGGGGGDEPEEPRLICNESAEVYWIAETRGGSGGYTTSLLKDSYRSRSILLTNLGTENITLSLKCESENNSCEYANITETSINLEANKLKQIAVPITILAPANESYGYTYYFNVILEDNYGACTGNIAFQNVLKIDISSIMSKITNNWEIGITDNQVIKIPNYIVVLFILLASTSLIIYVGRKISKPLFGYFSLPISIGLSIFYLYFI